MGNRDFFEWIATSCLLTIIGTLTFVTALAIVLTSHLIWDGLSHTIAMGIFVVIVGLCREIISMFFVDSSPPNITELREENDYLKFKLSEYEQVNYLQIRKSISKDFFEWVTSSRVVTVMTIINIIFVLSVYTVANLLWGYGVLSIITTLIASSIVFVCFLFPAILAESHPDSIKEVKDLQKQNKHIKSKINEYERKRYEDAFGTKGVG